MEEYGQKIIMTKKQRNERYYSKHKDKVLQNAKIKYDESTKLVRIQKATELIERLTKTNDLQKLQNSFQTWKKFIPTSPTTLET